jgi:transcriptional repressor NrdR
VVKKDGRREEYSRDKLRSSLEIACRKRPVPREKIESAIDEIEAEAFQREASEVSTRVLGEVVLRKLLKLDRVAYIRFASVYRSFDDPGKFIEELKTLYDKDI